MLDVSFRGSLYVLAIGLTFVLLLATTWVILYVLSRVPFLLDVQVRAVARLV